MTPDILIAVLSLVAILSGFIVIVVPWSKRLYELFEQILDTDIMMVCASIFFLSIMAITYLITAK